MTTNTRRGVDAALDFLHEHDERNLQQLDEFLRIPSVSADANAKPEVERAAQGIADELTRIGAEHAQVHQTVGHPIVTADWLHAGADRPTVLVYCHYDVQPTDPLDEWIRPPFEPRYEDGRVYARGSGDDKGQLFMHLKAAEAWLAGAGGPPVNLRFFFEGDEEVDSVPIEQFIKAHPELLKADVSIVSDTDMYDDEGTPAVTYGLRGIAYFEVKVHGPMHDIHSGQYGGAVDNPANVLVRMLASLQDDQGRFTVPGFYDDVRELTDAERAAYADLPFDEAGWRDAIGIEASGQGEAGFTLPERLSARPTFDVNGLWGGYSGEGSKTIIPAFAAAKFSTRLVPDQDFGKIEQQVVDHLKSIAPPTVRLEIKVIHGGAPALTELDSPPVRLAARALEEAFGKAPRFHRMGGSIPVVAELEKRLGLKSVLVGFASPNGNFHAPNEWMPLDNYRGGMDALVRLWEALGSATPEELRQG
jgi:acetylornithine deacetylase/succinyl-diaminopimelate desuccinylase-like protein